MNAFDNLFFEIQNEPWADNHAMGDFINPYLSEFLHGFDLAKLQPDLLIVQRAAGVVVRALSQAGRRLAESAATDDTDALLQAARAVHRRRVMIAGGP